MAELYTFTDRLIEDSELSLDLGLFIRCKFRNCELIYYGDGEADFVDCTFENCTWTFGRSAQRTISFLAALQHHTGAEGPKLVKGIFESIQSNPVVQVSLEDRGNLIEANETFRKRTIAP